MATRQHETQDEGADESPPWQEGEELQSAEERESQLLQQLTLKSLKSPSGHLLPARQQVQRRQQPKTSAARRLEGAELSPVEVASREEAASLLSGEMAVPALQ